MSLKDNNPYDDQFIDPPVKKSFAERSGIVPSKSKMSRVYNATSTSLLGVNTGYGESKYDKGINWATDIDKSDVRNSINDYRSDAQSGLTQLGTGLARAGVKAVTEIAKLPGVIGGIAMSPFVKEGEGYDTAFNNAWIRAIDGVNEQIKEDILPVYVKKSVQEGSFMDNITSTGFWATEGADGLGFMLGMMAPGAIISKLGMGAKLLGGARKAAQLLGMAEKTEAAVGMLKAAGMTGKAIDVGTGAIFNTIAESGSEAAGVGQDLDGKKPEFIKQHVAKRLQELNPNGIPEMIQAPMQLIQNPDGTQSMHSAGLIPNPEFEKIREQAYALAEDDFKEQRALAMRDTFKSNLAVLIIPNLLMSKALFGKAESKLVKEVEKTGLKALGQRGGKVLERYGKAFASEGFLEEASQTTAQNMFTQKAMRNELKRGDEADGGFITGGLQDFTIGEATDAYLDTVASTEGAKAIFLGGMMGAPLMSHQGRKEDVRNRKETNDILDNIDTSVSSFNTIFENDIYRRDPNDKEKFLYKKDNNGNDTSERLVDRAEALKVARSLNYNEAQSARLDQAIAEGNQEVVQELKQRAIFDMIQPAIFNNKAGLEALADKLKSDSQFLEIASRNSDESSKDQMSEFVNKTLETARYLQRQNEKFKDFGNDLISLKDERATPEEKERYVNILNNQYLNVKYQQYNSEAKLKELEEKRDSLLQELNIQRDIADISSNARQVNEAMSTNPLLKSVIEEINTTKQSIDKNIKDVNGLWSGKSAVAESFKNYIDNNRKEQEALSEEKIIEADKVIKNVADATDKKELDNAIAASKISKEEADNIGFEFQDPEIEEPDYYTEENQMISEEIDSKRAKAEEDRKKATKEIVSINDTIDYLNGLLEETIGNTTEEVKGLSKDIETKSKLFKSSTKSKTKKGQAIVENAADLKEDIRNAFQLANDIKDRISQLEANKKELEKLNDFLAYKIEYYGKLKEQGLDFKLLQDKINKLESKQGTLNKLISSIENTIKDLLNTLKEIFSIIAGFERKLNNFTETSGFSIDENEELKSIIENNPSKGSAYFNNKLNEITLDLNNALDHGEITQDVYDEKVKELDNLIKTLEKTSIQLDILKDLFVNEKPKEVKRKHIAENPYIQQKVAEKEAEFEEQENEEAEQEREFQREIKEDEILTNENNVPEVNVPAVTVDEAGDVETESIPEVEDETEDVSPEEFDMSEEDVETLLDGEVSGAKVISTNRSTGEPLSDKLNDFVEYERTPRDKSKDIVNFSVGDVSGKVSEAYERALKGKATEEDIKLLKSKLPIKIDISYDSIENGKTVKKTVSSYIEAETEANQKDPDSKEMFDLQTMPLRKSLINELIKNKSFKGLYGSIAKQYPGLLKVEKNFEDRQEDIVPKNNIFDLQVFEGMTDEEKVTYFQRNSAYVNWSGALVSTLDSKNVIRVMSPSNRGEVFLRIPRNDGSDFWLKLNVSKVSDEKTEAVFEMVKALSEISKTIKSPKKMQAITIDKFFEQLEEKDPELASRIKDSLSEEINLIDEFDKGKAANRTLSRLIDLIVYHRSSNTKTAFRLTPDGNLELGSLAYQLMDGQGFKHSITILKDEFEYEEAKSIVMKYLSFKRNNVMITTDSANLFVFNNKAYIEYLLGLKSGNPILTTNAVVNEPTFQGYSNIYLSPKVDNTKTEAVENKKSKEFKKEIEESKEKRIVPIELAPTDDQGAILANKERMRQILEKGKTSKTDKVDVKSIEQMFEESSEDMKAEILFSVAENLNILDELENVKEEDVSKFFKKMISNLNSKQKTVEEIKQICGF